MSEVTNETPAEPVSEEPVAVEAVASDEEAEAGSATFIDPMASAAAALSYALETGNALHAQNAQNQYAEAVEALASKDEVEDEA